jgi:hypothetical protein
MITDIVYLLVLAATLCMHSSSLSHRHGIPLVSGAFRSCRSLAKDLAMAWGTGELRYRVSALWRLMRRYRVYADFCASFFT